MKKKGKVLITGVCGMVGSVLSRYFLNEGYDVIGVDNLSGGIKENLDPAVNFYEVDICHPDLLSYVFECNKPDYVIHAAAMAAEILSPYIKRYTYHNNVIGSVNVINACVNNDVKKILFFSSIARYGNGKTPFSENSPIILNDSYAISKYCIEKDLEDTWQKFGLEYSTIIGYNIISKFQNYYDKYRNVLAIFVRQTMLGEDLTIYGDGKQTRSFSDCEFICEPIEKLLTKHNREAFNLGSENPTTVLELALKVLDIGQEFGYTKSKVKFLEERKESKYAWCRTSKASSLLNFKDNTDINKVIREMFQRINEVPRRTCPKMSYEIEKNMYSFWK